MGSLYLKMNLKKVMGSLYLEMNLKYVMWSSVLLVEFGIGGKIFWTGGRKIWPGLVGRPGPPMTKGVKTCSLGLKWLNFLSYFLLHKLELLLINIHQVSKFLVKKIKRDSIWLVCIISLKITILLIKMPEKSSIIINKFYL